MQKQTLKAHMIVHSDVKPFKCKVSAFGDRGINLLDISVISSSCDMVELGKQDLLTCTAVAFKLA